MNVKTMEGLAGASASIRMISTPMSVADEAERKGDTDKMQRALGYAAGLREQAEEYGEKASQGMKADAQEAKEKEKLQQEELIQARKEERAEQEKRIEAGGKQEASYDSAEFSEEGKFQAEMAAAASGSVDSMENMVYDKTGEAVEAAQQTGEAVNVSV